MKTVRTNEIFYGVQGEGVLAGLPMVFIRLQGCSLHCTYCDTPYSQESSGGESLSIESILKIATDLAPWKNSWVCVTGGEPLDQVDALYYLVRELKRNSYRLEIETNGCVKKPQWWTLVNSWVADMKCPSSGKDVWCRETEWYTNMRCDDQVKFVVGTEEDLQYTREVIRRNPASSPWVLISPVLQPYPLFDKEQEWLQRVIEFVKESRVYSDRIRFSLQTHKFCYPRDRRAV